LKKWAIFYEIGRFFLTKLGDLLKNGLFFDKIGLFLTKLGYFSPKRLDTLLSFSAERKFPRAAFFFFFFFFFMQDIFDLNKKVCSKPSSTGFVLKEDLSIHNQ
jgi:hypothetical protein